MMQALYNSYSYFKGIVLLLWVNLCYNISFYSIDFIELDVLSSKYVITIDSVLYGCAIFYPIFGWAADAYIGRYKAIFYSMILSLIGCVIMAAGVIVIYTMPNLKREILLFIVLVSLISWIFGYYILQATLLPFVIDQMIGASGAGLSTVVHWYYWCNCVPGSVLNYINSFLKPELTLIIISMSGLALALSSFFLFQNHLNTRPYITNPIKQIASVLNFAQKNKYPKNRSALTYWEDKVPSRLDLGMEKYGGPFTEEEVEDVKTILRLLVFIFCVSMVQLTRGDRDDQIQHFTPGIKAITYIFYNPQTQLGTYCIPLYYCIIRLAYRMLPLKLRICCDKLLKVTMIRVIGIGIIFIVISIFGFMMLDLVGHLMERNVTCMFVHSTNDVVLPCNIDHLCCSIQMV